VQDTITASISAMFSPHQVARLLYVRFGTRQRVPLLTAKSAQLADFHLLSFLSCRCLAVDAPSPEEKLTWLSDIAQEHSVEWDAHAAALEMLPAERQGGYGGPPGGGPGFGGGAGGGGGGGGYQQPQQGGQQLQQSGPYQQPSPAASNAPFLQGACLPGRVSCCQPGAMYTAAEENSQHAENFFLHLLVNVSNRVTLVLLLTYVLTWL